MEGGEAYSEGAVEWSRALDCVQPTGTRFWPRVFPKDSCNCSTELSFYLYVVQKPVAQERVDMDPDLWSTLPNDLLESTLAATSVSARARFLSVSRNWQTLLRSDPWFKKQVQEAAAAGPKHGAHQEPVCAVEYMCDCMGRAENESATSLARRCRAMGCGPPTKVSVEFLPSKYRTQGIRWAAKNGLVLIHAMITRDVPRGKNIFSICVVNLFTKEWEEVTVRDSRDMPAINIMCIDVLDVVESATRGSGHWDLAILSNPDVNENRRPLGFYSSGPAGNIGPVGPWLMEPVYDPVDVINPGYAVSQGTLVVGMRSSVRVYRLGDPDRAEAQALALLYGPDPALAQNLALSQALAQNMALGQALALAPGLGALGMGAQGGVQVPRTIRVHVGPMPWKGPRRQKIFGHSEDFYLCRSEATVTRWRLGGQPEATYGLSIQKLNQETLMWEPHDVVHQFRFLASSYTPDYRHTVVMVAGGRVYVCIYGPSDQHLVCYNLVDGVWSNVLTDLEPDTWSRRCSPLQLLSPQI